MGVSTHCEPNNGTLGTSELAVPNVSSTIMTYDPGAGNRRGIIVFLHGYGGSAPKVMPVPITDGGETLAGYSQYGDFKNAVVSDGWILTYPATQEDFAGGSGSIYTDAANDPGHGSRFLASTEHLWTHILTYLARTYGTGRPIIVMGASGGGPRSLHVAANMTNSIVGYLIHIPLTVSPTLNPAFTMGQNWWSIDWSGYDVTATQLNNVSVPGIIGYGTNDEAVAWASTTFTGSTGTTVSSINGSTMSVANPSNIVPGALVSVPTSAGTAYFQFTGNSGGLTGCTLLSGSGTIANGAAVTQSLTDQIITNATNAGQPITRYATNDVHEFRGTATNASTTIASGGGTNLSSFAGSGILNLTSATGFASSGYVFITGITGTGTSKVACIQYTGVSSNQLTGCTTLSGTGSISVGGSVIQNNDAAVYASWLANVIDPSYPVSF